MNKNITCTLLLAIFLFGISGTSYAQMSKKLLKDAELPPIENFT